MLKTEDGFLVVIFSPFLGRSAESASEYSSIGESTEEILEKHCSLYNLGEPGLINTKPSKICL